MFLCPLSDAEEEGELEPAKELIQPIAEKIMAKYKAKEEETPLLFFVAGEVCLPLYACNKTFKPDLATVILDLLNSFFFAATVSSVRLLLHTSVMCHLFLYICEKQSFGKPSCNHQHIHAVNKKSWR